MYIKQWTCISRKEKRRGKENQISKLTANQHYLSFHPLDDHLHPLVKIAIHTSTSLSNT